MQKRPEIKITTECLINPSESSEKLIAAIKNLVNIDITQNNNLLSGSSSDLLCLQPTFEQIRSKSIFSVLRRILLTNITGNSTFFLLNKQAATVNTAVLTENDKDSPLGTIKIILQTKDILQLIDNLAPE